MNTYTTSPAPAPARERSRRGFLKLFAGGLTASIFGGGAVGGTLTYWSSSQNTAPHPLVDAPPRQPLTVTTPGGIRIHHIQTGYVAVKSVHRSYVGRDGTGIPAVIADRRWTPWMPISAWVIEHPEGVLVIDTGETSQVIHDPDYFNCDRGTDFFYNSFLRFALQPEDEIVPQMQQLGIKPADVRWVVQTHLHSDHMGGLPGFKDSEIIVSDPDYPASTGTLPCRYPAWLSPTFSRFDDGSLPGFERVMQLTRAADVFIVPTPGHSPGHQSVMLVEDDMTYFFAGDASFDEAQMLAGGTAGIASQPAQMRQSLSAIRTYAQSTPTVYLPSHDPALRDRLQNRTTVQI
ncbi:MAG: N-acyl homoserine lactonase family protein [Chloroflexota bacterium]